MKKMNNKGFSLVELIIVIAIMAILIGVLAPQYIKYVERSRVSADKDILDSIYTACTTAAADPEVTDAPATAGTVSFSSGSSWTAEVYDTLGVSNITDITFKSKSASSSALSISVDSNGNFTVTTSGTGGSITVPE